MDHLIRGSEFLARHKGFKLVDRAVERERFASILMRSRASSVLLIGPGGVGCTALCLGIQAMKSDPDAPFDIVNKRLFWLDTNELFSSGQGEAINHRFQKIIARLERTHDSVLLIENARDFVESCRNGGTTHFLNALISTVRSGATQVVLEASEDDLDLVLKAHSDIRELFTILAVDEPAGDALLEIVRAAGAGLAAHHSIAIDDEAVLAAIELTTKYHAQDSGPSRAQPERSITLLDRSLAAYRLAVHKRPPGTMVQSEWAILQQQLRDLSADQRAGEVAITDLYTELDRESARRDPARPSFGDTPEVAALKQRIAAYQHEVDANKARFIKLADHINRSLKLGRDMVLVEFSDISGIPASKLSQNDVEKLRGLEGVLSRRIFGQDEVVRRLANGVKIARVGRRNTNRPQASYLFLGPSGVGKTEISKALAGALLDDEAALTRFDMSEYMEKHAVAKLIGAPPGYEGFEAGGILTNLMRRNGTRVLLFDEIEKAHPDIFNIMLQVLEDGRLTDNVGRTASFADAIIIMTTNIGQPHFLDENLLAEDAEVAAMEDLGATYRSEFLNRFAGRQNIICFKRLGIDSIEKIVRREIGLLDSVYGAKGLRVEIADADLNAFCQDQYDPRIGARGLPGFISANLEPAIVNTILADQNVQGVARVQWSHEHRKFEVEIGG